MCIRDRVEAFRRRRAAGLPAFTALSCDNIQHNGRVLHDACILYTSDAADDLLCVDLGGRRIIKKKKQAHHTIIVIDNHDLSIYNRLQNVHLNHRVTLLQ